MRPILLWIDPRHPAESVPAPLRDAMGSLGFEIANASDLPAVQRELAKSPVRAMLLVAENWDEATRAVLASLTAVEPAVPVLGITETWTVELADALLTHGAQELLLLDELEHRLPRALRSAESRHRVVRDLAEREERFSRAVDGAGDGLWDWDLETGKLYTSERWCRMTGLPRSVADDWAPRTEISIDDWLGKVHPDDRTGLDSALAQHLDGGSERLKHEHRLRVEPEAEAPADRYRWVLVRGRAVRDRQGRAVRLAGSLHDIDRRKRAEERLIHNAFHDTLTGLPNRALFSDRLRQALRRRHRRPDEGFAVLYFDLDRFKQVNDSLGHSVGDELLVQIARGLRDNLRPGDTVARLGGDEFGLLVHDVSSTEDATQVADRVQHLLAQKHVVGQHEIVSSASIGIALAIGSSEYQRPEEMLRDADLALLRAKANGRATYEIFDREMDQRARALVQLESELRQAVNRKDFVLHYQPIIAIKNGRLVGFEALMRWVHPSRGLVPTREFLGVAEATGLIVPLGWWVLETACRQMADWQRRFPGKPALAVSANVSGKLFLDADAVDRLTEVLEEAALPPESLWLEITERVLLDHGEEVLHRLAEIRALGIQLHLDDFGTGYSSISHLQRFRYDTLKIDPSYIHRLDREEESRNLVRTLVTLGRQLEMNVIAEGVETANQFQRLKELHCPEGQGHWFARPMDARSAEGMIRHQARPEMARPAMT